jgi:MFS family permease
MLSTESQNRMKKFRIPVLFCVALLYWMGLYFFAPSLPVYVQGKTADLAVVGTILAMYGLWQAIARLPAGIAADWLGLRRPFILAGLVIVAIGVITLLLAATPFQLGAGRALTGLGAATWVPMVVLFTSLYPSEEGIRATGLMSLAATLGRLIGTAFNGPLNQAGGFSLAFFVSLGALLVGFGLVLGFPEQRHPAQVPGLARLKVLFLRRDVWLPSLLSALLHYGDWAASYSFIPILARQFGADALQIGQLVTLNLAIVLLGNLGVSRIGSRVSPAVLMGASFACMAAGLAGAALAPGLLGLAVAQATIGLGYGIGYPTLLGMGIQRVSGPERTSAMGLHQSVYAGGMFAGPWLSGLLADRLGVQPMFAITAAAVLALGLWGWMAIRSK